MGGVDCSRDARWRALIVDPAAQDSIIPFPIDAGFAVGVGADVALDLQVGRELDLDRGGAALGVGALLGADEDVARDVAASAQARPRGRAFAGLEVEAIE